MKRLVQFCIRIGFLPRRRWFYDLVMRTIWRPAAIRDAGEIDGWLEIGNSATPEMVAAIREWWTDYGQEIK